MEVEKMYEYISAKVNETLIMLDSKRNYLEPVFIMNDTTDMAITKALKGEGLIEKLRTEIVSIRVAALRQDADGVYEAKKKALRALSELGELLVEKFPYDVPKEGKFSYLPRLLGRAKVTFTIVRPGNRKADKDVLLGNVTVLADGYAAPVTAGNFVDLAARNFYNGLPVKDLSKRLGVTASLTMAEDSLVAYDIASTVDKIAGEDGVIKKSLDRFLKKVDEGLGIELEDVSKADNTNVSSNSNTDNNTVLTSMPVAGSFNEGFYDPLTAQPRRIPLEIVQFDRLLGTAKLSYESGFSTNAATTNSGLGSLLESNARSPPLLTFDIPGLVAMNHPDLNLNGGSSEFFCLTKKDLVPERTTLLNGKYAPFGYVIEGLDLMMDLQAGDIISATSVDESGMMNLMKIRGTSFADAMNSDENN
jgi:cyclophilin family peptidyl-prolyl cis-trans isomerase